LTAGLLARGCQPVICLPALARSGMALRPAEMIASDHSRYDQLAGDFLE